MAPVTRSSPPETSASSREASSSSRYTGNSYTLTKWSTPTRITAPVAHETHREFSLPRSLPCGAGTHVVLPCSAHAGREENNLGGDSCVSAARTQLGPLSRRRRLQRCHSRRNRGRGERGSGTASSRIESRDLDADHVLVFSIDGLHQSDLARCKVAANGDSTLAKLAGRGVAYTRGAHDDALGLVPRRASPSPRAAPPSPRASTTTTATTGPCTRRATAVHGGAGHGDHLRRERRQRRLEALQQRHQPGVPPAPEGRRGKCTVVYPHDFVRVNTIFEVVKRAGGYTAWSDKHPSYRDPERPVRQGLDDLYAPEQASNIANAPAGTVNGVNLGATLAQCDGLTNSLPLSKISDYTTCIPSAWAYDDVRVEAILHQIHGHRSDGSARAPVPTVFGMNFQAVSIAEKLSPVGGYLDSGAPSAQLAPPRSPTSTRRSAASWPRSRSEGSSSRRSSSSPPSTASRRSLARSSPWSRAGAATPPSPIRSRSSTAWTPTSATTPPPS